MEKTFLGSIWEFLERLSEYQPHWNILYHEI